MLVRTAAALIIFSKTVSIYDEAPPSLAENSEQGKNKLKKLNDYLL